MLHLLRRWSCFLKTFNFKLNLDWSKFKQIRIKDFNGDRSNIFAGKILDQRSYVKFCGDNEYKTNLEKLEVKAWFGLV